MRILLVEDEPSAARFIAKGLREATYAVDVASDGNAAARQCEQNDYDAVILDVGDTGPGMPPEDRERVFERFVRLDPARGTGGAGLGLAIARWVAEAHGGQVRIVTSGPGGSIFAASLPG